jgi:hypothetical protein
MVLGLQGEQGSGKSQTARILRSIVDPCEGDLLTCPRSEHDLMISANNGWILAFDNISVISDWLSDALCKVSTGSALATRTLYTDSDQTILKASRPLLLNGITTVITRHDLLDRSIILQLPILSETTRRSENDIWEEFKRIHPSVLGGLLSAVSAALRNKNKVKLEKMPRMADAALWVTAMEDKISWEGTASDLLKELRETISEDIKRSKFWPKAPHALSNRLTRAAYNLRKIGWKIDFLKRTSSSRLIHIYKINYHEPEEMKIAKEVFQLS